MSFIGIGLKRLLKFKLSFVNVWILFKFVGIVLESWLYCKVKIVILLREFNCVGIFLFNLL